MERIIATFNRDGSLRGASLTDFDGDPLPLDTEALVALFPTLNTAALARVAELEAAATATAETHAQALADKDREKAEALKALADAHAEEIARLTAPPTAAGVTKLTIMRRLGDKWPDLKAILAQMPEAVQDAWTLAQEIRADDPLFLDHADALKSALGLTHAEFTALLTP